MLRCCLTAVVCGMMCVGAPAFSQDDGAKEVEAIIKDLKNKAPATRLRAVKAIQAYDGDLSAAARPLCDALLESKEDLRDKLLESAEKVCPDLTKPLTLLIIDYRDQRQEQKGVDALSELASLGEAAEPAMGLIVKMLERSLTPKRGQQTLEHPQFIAASFLAIEQIKADDPEALKLMKLAGGTTNRDMPSRGRAIQVLLTWAGEDLARRKELIPLIKAGLEHPEMQVECMKYAVAMGSQSKDLLPLLKKMKFGKSEAIRERATDAIQQIEEAIRNDGGDVAK